MPLLDGLTFAALNLAIVLGALTLLWGISIRIKNAAIIDAFWGIACALPGVVSFGRIALSEERAVTPVGILLTICVCLWALRLFAYLGWRNIGKPEDYRYAAMRAEQGSDRAFAIWSLPMVFWLQGLIAWTVSLPIQWGQFGAGTITPLVIVGLIIFAIGLFFETVGDWQLRAFKAKPENTGRLMTQGLWSWTRHPNYFGDATVWAGLAIMALGAPLGSIALISPFVMAYFLIFVTGKAMTEEHMNKKYPEYAAYKNSVSGFFPFPPKKPSASSATKA